MKAELSQMADSAKILSRPVELDQTSVGRLSRMDAMQVKAMTLATEARRKVQLVKIETALKYINTEEFGYCVKCGDEISEKRLRLDPTVSCCVPCAGDSDD
ncbi:TraR/DksA family transcriptional regulator [Asticcacaulis sp.]|uniref:TraR/DksA family transcriptional regulator n=1 Tax=Asticcacaulis sp. TaxID=1872648 RepID=UPI00391DE5A5